MKPIFCLSLFFALFAAGCAKPKTPVFAGYENLRLAKAGLNENIIAADIKLYNPNDYPLQIKEAALDWYVNGQFLGKTNNATQYTLHASDTTRIPLEVRASAKDLLLHAAPLLRAKEVTLRIDGKVKAGRSGFFVSVPVNYEGVQATGLGQ